MLNLRAIDNRYILSGGWENIPEDAIFLKQANVRAVLDLQFTPEDYSADLHNQVRDILETAGIDYFVVPMNDGENQNLEKVYELANLNLEFWEKTFTHKRDRILIKCGAGVSRSPSVLIYHFCIRDRLTYTEARNKIWKVDRIQPLLPISIDQVLEAFLKEKFPDYMPQFGVKGED